MTRVAKRSQRVFNGGVDDAPPASPTRRLASTTTLPFSSSTMRLAVFGPMPGIVATFLASSLSMAKANSVTLIVRSAPSAVEGPTPGVASKQFEELTLLERREAEELNGVFAHHGEDEELDHSSKAQVLARGDVNLVADALHVEQQAPRFAAGAAPDRASHPITRDCPGRNAARCARS